MKIKNVFGFIAFVMGASIGTASSFEPFEILVVGFLFGLFILAMDWNY